MTRADEERTPNALRIWDPDEEAWAYRKVTSDGPERDLARLREENPGRTAEIADPFDGWFGPAGEE